MHRERFKSAVPAVTELERLASAATAQLMDAQGAGQDKLLLLGWVELFKDRDQIPKVS